MKVIFLKSFSKDLDRIKKPKDKELILGLIDEVKDAKSVLDVTSSKKLVGQMHIGSEKVVGGLEFL